ncbi:MAG: glycine zipper 2TM domain-containing protein [Verrucomicrobia bacterium]|nr:glycine zipper 2TM domain-containing protein [Verrucomicrobiota bacterium]
MKTYIKTLMMVPVLVALTACQEMPGERRTQGAVIGGAAGAAAGAAVAKDNRLLGALIGGALGAGGGYVIAAQTDKIESGDRDAATQAARKAQENPATPEDARRALTADLNMDGFVTLDEVVAMEQAGLTDQEMLSRMRQTDQIFELTDEHRRYLRERGVSNTVVTEMASINRAQREAIINQRGDVIGRPTVQ